jgi:hypothetical protein
VGSLNILPIEKTLKTGVKLINWGQQMQKRKPTQAQRGRMVFIPIHSKDPEGFKTIQLSDFSFSGDRRIYISTPHKTGKD